MLATLMSVFVGAAVTWVVAWWYYKKAGEELRAEARELQRLTTLILHALQQAGLAQVNWDDEGRPKGINITINIPTGGTVTHSAPAASIVQGPP